jgi:hypothetical protein
MNAMNVPKGFVFFPEHLHWTAQQLAEAVPLRLHQLYAYDIGAFDAGRDGRGAPAAHSPARLEFAPCPPLPERFSVR